MVEINFLMMRVVLEAVSWCGGVRYNIRGTWHSVDYIRSLFADG